MVPEDVYDLATPSDPRVSPGGGWVAFVVTTVDREANRYAKRIWVAPADGSEPPRPFTAGTHRDALPRWSPDGRFLAFVSHRRGETGSEVYVMPATGGEPSEAAAFPEEVEELAWSPDGSRLALLVRVRDEGFYGKQKDLDRPPRRVARLIYREDDAGWIADRPKHLFVVAADGSEPPRQLTDGEWHDDGLAWSPTGEEIAFTSARHGTWDWDLARDLFTVPAEGGEPVRLTETGDAYALVSWGPDGSTLAFAVEPDPANAPRHGKVGVIGRPGGAVRMLTADLDRNALPFPRGREPVWAGSDIHFRVEDSGNTHLYRVPADGSGKPEVVLGGDRHVADYDAAAGTIAFVATSPHEPPELFVLAGKEERRLTDLSRPLREGRKLVAPVRFTAVSPDGNEVEAWMVPPPGTEPGRRYPALLSIHGGPFAQYGNRFLDEFQVLAGAGYALLYANPRGSSGYAEAWGRAIRGRLAPEPGSGWGGVDLEDLEAVADEAIRRFDLIDPDRLGVLGGSYGGYMTSWIVSHGDRFRAACSERACNNLYSLSYTSDFGPSLRSYFGPTYLEAAEEYLRMSPITHVESIRTPMLILHSEQDLRCPIEQAEQLYVALKLLGREVEFVRFPGESHELSRSGAPAHRVERFRIILDFFGRHLS